MRCFTSDQSVKNLNPDNFCLPHLHNTHTHTHCTENRDEVGALALLSRKPDLLTSATSSACAHVCVSTQIKEDVRDNLLSWHRISRPPSKQVSCQVNQSSLMIIITYDMIWRIEKDLCKPPPSLLRNPSRVRVTRLTTDTGEPSKKLLLFVSLTTHYHH